jgi:MFS family permease
VPPATDALRALRVPNFRWYYLAESVNMVGSTMAPVALAFAVLQVSDSASALGVVLAANTVPMVVFLLFGGVLADRLPRVLLIRGGNLVMGLTQGAAAWLVISGHAELWMLVVLEAANGTVSAVVFPAMQGLFPQLVPRELLQQANVLQSMVRGALRVVGPTISALLVVGAGPGWALAVDALTWVAAAALLVRVELPGPGKRAERSSTITDLREGWSVFVGNTWLWVVVLAFGALNAIHTGAWFTLGPAHAKDTIGATGWGYLMSAESIGLLATTLVMLRVRLERPLLVGMLGCAFMGLPVLLFGLLSSLPVLVVAAFLAGAGIEVFSLGWSLAMQENIEERMLSRAFSYDALGSYVAMPVGQLVYGPLGEAFGYRDVLVVSGVVYAVVAVGTLSSRSVRQLRRMPATGTLSPTSPPAPG